MVPTIDEFGGYSSRLRIADDNMKFGSSSDDAKKGKQS